MDFPKSVPGVGLVSGQFVDENPSIGQQGSLIPSAWGNAITQELLNVIQAAGLAPNEAQTDQLLEAIRTLVPERSAFARVSGTVALPATAFGIYALADGGAAATVTLPSTEDLVDDTELLLFANHANTAAVQVKAVTGQMVQGPAALMGASTTAFMLPAGGDWVRLRSEKAQGRWVVVATYSTEVTALRSQLGIAGQHKNLYCWATGTDALVHIAADQLFVESLGGQTIKLRDVDLTIDTATVGANGLDAGVLAANTWYSVWVISDGVNVRGLVSLSANAPTIPALYTYKARVGWVRTDASSNKFPLSFKQMGNQIFYVPAIGSNLTGVPQMASGVQGNAYTPVWVPVPVAGFVPPTAKKIALVMFTTYTSPAIAAPNGSYGGCQSLVNPPPILSWPANTSIAINSNADLPIESGNIYYAAANANTGLYVKGWEDSL